MGLMDGGRLRVTLKEKQELGEEGSGLDYSVCYGHAYSSSCF